MLKVKVFNEITNSHIDLEISAYEALRSAVEKEVHKYFNITDFWIVECVDEFHGYGTYKCFAQVLAHNGDYLVEFHLIENGDGYDVEITDVLEVITTG